ncbi:MAG: hypothetical protein EOM41_08195 [Bacilli bacterium]|nr:hypothetical protein [Bacilli bacterium]
MTASPLARSLFESEIEDNMTVGVALHIARNQATNEKLIRNQKVAKIPRGFITSGIKQTIKDSKHGSVEAYTTFTTRTDTGHADDFITLDYPSVNGVVRLLYAKVANIVPMTSSPTGAKAVPRFQRAVYVQVPTLGARVKGMTVNEY